MKMRTMWLVKKMDTPWVAQGCMCVYVMAELAGLWWFLVGGSYYNSEEIGDHLWMTRVGTIPQLQKLLAQAQTASIVESLLFREKSRTHTEKVSGSIYICPLSLWRCWSIRHKHPLDGGKVSKTLVWSDFGRPEFGEVYVEIPQLVNRWRENMLD